MVNVDIQDLYLRTKNTIFDWAASLTSTMTAPKIDLFILNLENVIKLLGLMPDTLVAMPFFR